MMSDEEGVIKYQLNHTKKSIPDTFELEDLIACRQNLVRKGLLGRDIKRYGGLGFGNVSRRLANDFAFVITGSQTGHLPELQREHFVVVSQYQRISNTLTSYGLVKPSSESSAHALFYALSSEINAVIHVHSPDLWCYGARAGLPATAASVPYGSLELLAEIEALWESQVFAHCPILVMLGHTDGVICFGPSLQDADVTLGKYWREARGSHRNDTDLRQ